jgi:hypothetical protein
MLLNELNFKLKLKQKLKYNYISIKSLLKLILLIKNYN